MAIQVATAKFVSIGGNDLSAFCDSISLTYEKETQDSTTFGSGGNRTVVAGLGNWSLNLGLKQNFDASSLDSILFPLIKAGAAVAMIVRNNSGSKSTSNPEFTGNVVLTSYPIMGGNVGDINAASIACAAASDLTRATS